MVESFPTEQPTRSARSLPAKLIMVAAVIVAAVAYLVFTAVQTSAVYYMTVSELLAGGPATQGQAVRVAGNVVAGSIRQEQGGLVVHFDAEDATGRIPITYRGVLPDIFGDGVEVVVEGRHQENGVFAASTLFAKCPSKFES